MTETTIACPFCAEPIQPRAKKCKHCGEWLDVPAKRTKGALSRGSSDARAVAKGLKQKEADDSVLKFFAFLTIVISAGLYLLTHSVWLAGGAFVVLIILMSIWYYRE